MNQLSIIGFPILNEELSDHVRNIERYISESDIGKYFSPIGLDHLHGTIIGLEKTNDRGNYFNLNLYNQLNKKQQMNFERAIEIIIENLPITVRFGGFSPEFELFSSWGKSPYESSFKLFSRGPDATMIGWPHKNGDFSENILFNIRNTLENRCNIRHKYAIEKDNGFFINLGKFSSGGLDSAHMSQEDNNRTTKLEEIIRNYILLNPIDITLDIDHLKIVKYRKIEQGRIKIFSDYSLSTNVFSNQFIQNLY